ncbi:DUF202 domain-containing protein [Halostreptopolyspora alba]|uniref:DUF202 domain-containing protein n=1 Tax=Halostreptopolyspora alba TaxID=2487137 RepID=A0A3N0E917_9ACTN|nr:DUF202 domain-containing protein [Nocardiopsaceae bacterium YIM 96095]
MRMRDPALQPERTLLSWQRTIAVTIVVALLYLRHPSQAEEPAMAGFEQLYRVAVTVGVMAMSGVLIVHVRRRWKRADAETRDGAGGRVMAPLARPWALSFVSAGVAVFGSLVAAGAVLT